MNKSVSAAAAFQMFDETLATVMGEKPASFAEMSGHLRRAIDVLPQRGAVADENINPWIERVLYMASVRTGEELENASASRRTDGAFTHACWHVRRLSGIGGSESGAILSHMSAIAPALGDHCGENTFESARNIVAGKLLIMAPSAPTRDMSRGVRAERHIRNMYLDSRGVESCEGELKKWQGHRPTKAPWIIGTPDDFVISPEGTRKLIDYKAPTAESFEKFAKGIPFEYQAQLHHYAVVASSAQAPFGAMSLAVFSARDFEVVEFPVEISREFAANLVRASSNAWKRYVMAGVLPEVVEPENITPDDPGLVRLGHRIALMKMIQDEITRRQADMGKQLDAYFTHISDHSTGKANFEVSTYSRTRKWDEEALIGLADAAGIDAGCFIQNGGKPDATMMASMLEGIRNRVQAGEPAEAAVQELLLNGIPMQSCCDKEGLANALEAAGIDTMPASGVDTRYVISSKKKGPIAEMVSGLRDAAADIVNALENVGEQNIEQIMSAARPQDVETEDRGAEMEPE